MASSSSKPSDLQALRALSARGLLWLVGAAAALPVSFVLLKTTGYRRTVRLGELLSPRRATPLDAAARATSTTRLVWIANRKLHLPSTCLSRSLALWYLLRLQGVATEIQIGVRPSGEPLDAHAWVTHDGRVLNEFEDVHERYAVLRPHGR